MSQMMTSFYLHNRPTVAFQYFKNLLEICVPISNKLFVLFSNEEHCRFDSKGYEANLLLTSLFRLTPCSAADNASFL